MADLTDIFGVSMPTEHDILTFTDKGIEYHNGDKIVMYYGVVPSEHIAEVVRCKDCEYFRKSGNTLSDFCDEIALARREDDFCSRGKRKKDG